MIRIVSSNWPVVILGQKESPATAFRRATPANTNTRHTAPRRAPTTTTETAGRGPRVVRTANSNPRAAADWDPGTGDLFAGFERRRRRRRTTPGSRLHMKPCCRRADAVPLRRVRGRDGPLFGSEGHCRRARWRATAVNSPNGPATATLVGQDTLSAVFCDGATFNVSFAFLKHANADAQRKTTTTTARRRCRPSSNRARPVFVVGFVINFPDR